MSLERQTGSDSTGHCWLASKSFKYFYVCIYTCVYTYIYTCMCVDIIYIYTHTYIHIYIYIHMDFLGGQWVKNLPATQETQETQIRSLGPEVPLKEGMATHSSILAWRIPWTEELSRLQSKGSQRVGSN